jgi:hypothetical protein
VDSIDITDLVEKARSTFVDWGVGFLLTEALAVPGLQWLAWPVISDVVKMVLRAILNRLSASVVMQAFFLNTAMRKAAQAKDYLEAVRLKQALPDDVDDEDYERAERAEIKAFAEFVTLTA